MPEHVSDRTALPEEQPTSRPWQLRPADPERVHEIAAALGCPQPIAHLLVTRGITHPSDADLFFHPSFDHLHSPFLLLGMSRAVERIQHAVRAAEPILIYGDYDVDGTTATVLLKTAIERIASPDLPARVTYHVPHRLREGYGIQPVRLAEAARAGIRLVISVDTGIRAFDAAAQARELGLDLIVTDHHLPDPTAGLPEALAVLNPAQPGCRYPFKSLCGAAVAFKLAHALLLAHATTEAQQGHLRHRLLPSFLKLVAIATVADAVPLVGENRTVAALGLRELANPVQPGLRALLHVANLPLDRAPSATEVGFRIGPRINAAGRMDVASDVVELFLTRDLERARDLAEKLNRLNDDRRSTEAAALSTIDEHLGQRRSPSGAWPAECFILDDPAWHRGVLGILASRIVDRTGRPALVLSHDGDEAHGSGRSIAGFHLLDALTSVHAVGCTRLPPRSLFTRFGGHAHAVGFSLPIDRLHLLRTRMQQHTRAHLGAGVLEPPLAIDAEIPPAGIVPELWRWLERCAPFGNGNPEPVFLTCGLLLEAPPRILKDKHVCLNLLRPADRTPIRALGWSRSLHWPTLCTQMRLSAGSAVDLAFRLRWNESSWDQPRGGALELEMVALRLS